MKLILLYESLYLVEFVMQSNMQYFNWKMFINSTLQHYFYWTAYLKTAIHFLCKLQDVLMMCSFTPSNELHVCDFHTSAAMLRSVLFWDITQRQVVILYWRSGTTYRTYIQGSSSPRRKERFDFMSPNKPLKCVTVANVLRHSSFANYSTYIILLKLQILGTCLVFS